MKEISRNESKNCLRRLTAVDRHSPKLPKFANVLWVCMRSQAYPLVYKDHVDFREHMELRSVFEPFIVKSVNKVIQLPCFVQNQALLEGEKISLASTFEWTD